MVQALAENKQSETQIARYQETIDKVHADLKHENTEVREIITAYYRVLIEMTLVNSNLFSIVYVISEKMMRNSLQKRAMQWASKHDPKPAMVFKGVEQERDLIGLHA